MNYRHTIKLSLAMAGLFFMLGFFYKYHLPRIEQWLLVEIESVSQTHSPVRIWPKKLEINLIPIGITLKDVRLLPQKNLAGYLKPTSVGKVELRLNLFDLLAGQIHFSRVTIADATFDFNVSQRYTKFILPHQGRPSSRKKIPLSLERLASWPVSGLQLQNITLNAKLSDPAVQVHVASVRLMAESEYRSLRTNLSAHDVQIQKNGSPVIYRANLRTNFLLDREGIYFSRLELSRGQSFVSAAGAIEGNVLSSEIKKVHVDVESKVDMKDVTKILRETDATRVVPKMWGLAKIDGGFDYKPRRPIHSWFKVQTAHFGVDNILVGNATFHGKTDGSSIRMWSSKIKNIYGEVDIPHAALSLDHDQNLNFVLKSQNFDLQQFFRSLDLTEIPVYVQIHGNMPCSGHLKPPFEITCKGSAAGQNFSVNTSVQKPAFNVVRLNHVAANGQVSVTPTGVSYQANLLIGSKKGQQSQGESSGQISFLHGFKIQYSTDKLQFQNVANLAGLDVKGLLAVKGTTQGNSQTATIDLAATGDHIGLLNYEVGRPQFQMRYKSGVLSFSHILGVLGKTRYDGELAINLIKNRIKLTARSPFLEVSDLTRALSRTFKSPITFSGTGDGSLKLWGPLKLNQLSYDLGTNLFRGSIAGESFGQLTFDVSSRNGDIQTQNVNLKKGGGSVDLIGSMDAKGRLNLRANGQGFQIEQFEAISNLGLNVTGNVSFQAHLTGPITAPTFMAHGRLSQTTVGSQPAGDSYFHVLVDPKKIDLGAQLLGNTLAGRWQRVRGLSGSSDFQFNISNWNFADSLSALSDSIQIGSYVTKLSANGEVSFPNRDWRMFSGHLTVNNFEMQNGVTEMSTKSPMTLTARDGVVQAKNFHFTGTDNTFVRLQSDASQPGQLALSLNGNVDLSLMSLFTPFLNDLRGTNRFSLLLTGVVDHPHFSGAFDIRNALVKIKGFPHSFEQMSSDITFNNNRISINSVKGRIAGGLLLANGHVSVLGPLNIPVSINGSFKDSRFDVPKGFKTHGSGEFYVRGSWFPYTLGVNYVVDSGSIEPKNSSPKKTEPVVKPSIYLPKFLTARRFSPIKLAMNISIPNEIPVHMMISRLNIQSQISGQLHIAGPPQYPLFTGNIVGAKGGKVGFRDNTFDLSSAKVTYQNAPPDDPVLEVRGSTKLTAYLKNSETRDFDVDLAVRGPAKNPKIMLTSDPPLSQSDLISLLTLGFISENPQDFTAQNQINVANPNSQLANTGAQFGTALISDSLGLNSIFEKKLGVHLNISSSYDSIDQTTKPTITASKQWNPRFGTTVSREIGTVNVNNFSAEYKLNNNVSVLGSWEGRQMSGADQSPLDQENNDIFGLDLQYKREFK